MGDAAVSTGAGGWGREPATRADTVRPQPGQKRYAGATAAPHAGQRGRLEPQLTQKRAVSGLSPPQAAQIMGVIQVACSPAQVVVEPVGVERAGLDVTLKQKQ